MNVSWSQPLHTDSCTCCGLQGLGWDSLANIYGASNSTWNPLFIDEVYACGYCLRQPNGNLPDSRRCCRPCWQLQAASVIWPAAQGIPGGSLPLDARHHSTGFHINKWMLSCNHMRQGPGITEQTNRQLVGTCNQSSTQSLHKAIMELWSVLQHDCTAHSCNSTSLIRGPVTPIE